MVMVAVVEEEAEAAAASAAAAAMEAAAAAMEAAAAVAAQGRRWGSHLCSFVGKNTREPQCVRVGRRKHCGRRIPSKRRSPNRQAHRDTTDRCGKASQAVMEWSAVEVEAAAVVAGSEVVRAAWEAEAPLAAAATADLVAEVAKARAVAEEEEEAEAERAAAAVAEEEVEATMAAAAVAAAKAVAVGMAVVPRAAMAAETAAVQSLEAVARVEAAVGSPPPTRRGSQSHAERL